MNIPTLSLEGKVAIITGGRRGIGKAIALGFAGVGADVAVCDCVIDDGKLEAVAEEIRGYGRRSLAIQVDVTQKTDVDNMVQKVLGEFSVIDILVNNAGVDSDYPLLQTTEGEWQRVIDIDLKGYYLCSQAVGAGMVARKRGNIINLASAAGIRGFNKKNTYNIAKAGVIMLTKVLARDLGKHNIRVNAIAPSIVKSDMTRDLMENPKAAAAEAVRIPLGRLAEVNDIVGPAVFLASEASGYVTGHTIVVDGGQLA